MPQENIHHDTDSKPFLTMDEYIAKAAEETGLASDYIRDHINATHAMIDGIEADLDENTYESEMVNIGVTELESIEQGITLLNELLIEKMGKATPKTRSYNNTAIVKQIESDLERAETSAVYIDNLINRSCLEY
tara:strand:+ start:82 stop:483 length:402 start_codon:yes stop_codon:yes gene_type:complete